MSDGGKGDAMRPTDHNKWSSGYDNIKWTTEEDEDRIQNSSSAKSTVANSADRAAETGQETLENT